MMLNEPRSRIRTKTVSALPTSTRSVETQLAVRESSRRGKRTTTVIRKVPINAEIRGSAPRAFAIGRIRTITVAARIARYAITDSRIAMFTA